jgi:hypothetical protein
VPSRACLAMQMYREGEEISVIQKALGYRYPSDAQSSIDGHNEGSCPFCEIPTEHGATKALLSRPEALKPAGLLEPLVRGEEDAIEETLSVG